MASKLALQSIPDLSISKNGRQKLNSRTPQFPPVLLPSSPGCFRPKFPNVVDHVYGDKGGEPLYAVKEEIQHSTVDAPVSETESSASKLVLVVGGTGGVGQLIVASLLNRNIKSRLLLRDPAKAESLFGKQEEDILQVWTGDTRIPDDLDPAMFEESCFIGSHTCNLLHRNYSFSFTALEWR